MLLGFGDEIQPTKENKKRTLTKHCHLKVHVETALKLWLFSFIADVQTAIFAEHSEVVSSSWLKGLI